MTEKMNYWEALYALANLPVVSTVKLALTTQLIIALNRHIGGLQISHQLK